MAGVKLTEKAAASSVNNDASFLITQEENGVESIRRADLTKAKAALLSEYRTASAQDAIDATKAKEWRSVSVTTTEDVNLLSVDIDKDAVELVITYNITKSNDTSAYLWIASSAVIGSNDNVFNRPGPFTTARTQAHLLTVFLRDGKCGSTIYQGVASGTNWFTTTTYTNFRANGKVLFSFGTVADIVSGSTVTIYYR